MPSMSHSSDDVPCSAFSAMMAAAESSVRSSRGSRLTERNMGRSTLRRRGELPRIEDLSLRSMRILPRGWIGVNELRCDRSNGDRWAAGQDGLPTEGVRSLRHVPRNRATFATM